MSNRTNNLHSFSISKDDNKQNEDLIQMWHELDNDSTNGYAVTKIKLTDWVDDGYDDLAKIERILQWIEKGHGSFSSQFLSVVSEGEYEYSVAVSFLN